MDKIRYPYELVNINDEEKKIRYSYGPIGAGMSWMAVCELFNFYRKDQKDKTRQENKQEADMSD